MSETRMPRQRSIVTDNAAERVVQRKPRKPRTPRIVDSEETVVSSVVSSSEETPRQVDTTVSGDKQEYVAPDATVVEEVSTENAQETVQEKVQETVVEQESKDDTAEEIKEYVKSGYTFTPHKYNIGDTVWVPFDTVINIAKPFDKIKRVQQYIAKKVTVSACMITKHVSYMFKESQKLMIAEQYVYTNEEDCKKRCEELMNG